MLKNMRRLGSQIGWIVLVAMVVGCGGQVGNSGNYGSGQYGAYGQSGFGGNSPLNSQQNPYTSPYPANLRLLEFRGKAIFVSGINIPGATGDAAKASAQDAVLKAVSDLGVNVVREFLSTDPTPAAMNANEDLIKRAKKYKVNLLGVVAVPSSALKDDAATKEWLNKSLLPLVKNLKNNATVLAFELQLTAPTIGSTATEAETDQAWTPLRTMLKTTCELTRKEDEGRLIGAGLGQDTAAALKAGRLRGLGLDWYAMEAYGDPPKLSDVREFGADRPVVVVDFGQASKTIEDDAQLKAHVAAIEAVRSNGYAGWIGGAYSKVSEADPNALLDAVGKPRPVVAEYKRLAKMGPSYMDTVANRPTGNGTSAPGPLSGTSSGVGRTAGFGSSRRG